MGGALAIFLSFAATIFFAAYVFAPITRHNSVAGTGRIYLADLFSLVLLWPYPLVFARLVEMSPRFGGSFESSRFVVLAMLEIVLTAVWLGVIRSLPDRAAGGTTRRFVLIGLAVPGAMAATLVLLGSMMATISMLARDVEFSATPIIVLASCVAGGLACRWAMSWGAPLPANSESGASPRIEQ